MNSVILQIASRIVRTLLILFALIALLRGHNHPGGGFIGGMLAGLSIAYRGFAYNITAANEMIKFKPHNYLALGLIIVLVSVIPSLYLDDFFMQGEWVTLAIGAWHLKIGTPLVFDIGVFFVVIGVSVLFLFSLKRQNLWK
ncbi:MAG: MnhB domain-containing protein [Bacteroidales bacterium]|jgi:multicomponent Na+:H+ antiporter subunit B